MEFRTRMPVVPTPHAGERMTSWLQRLSSTYDLSPHEFLRASHLDSELTKDQFSHLDQIAPADFLKELAIETGIKPAQLRHMSLADWIVSLRSLEEADAHHPTFSQYIYGYRVFDWPLDLNSPAMVPRVAWLTDDHTPLICPYCYEADPWCQRQLVWECGLLSSCPMHNCETTSPGLPPSTVMGPRPIDRVTFDIMAAGHALMPNGRVVHGRQWFRFLRSLICELEQHPGFLDIPTQNDEPTLKIWKLCGVTLPHVLQGYNFFEISGGIRRKELLTLANVAGAMLISGDLMPPRISLAYPLFAH